MDGYESIQMDVAVQVRRLVIKTDGDKRPNSIRLEMMEDMLISSLKAGHDLTVVVDGFEF